MQTIQRQFQPGEAPSRREMHEAIRKSRSRVLVAATLRVAELEARIVRLERHAAALSLDLDAPSEVTVRAAMARSAAAEIEDD